MRREDPESVVLPPHVLGTALVMRDAQTALSVGAFEAPISEQRAQDHLDLHRIRDDATKYAFWMLPHALYVGLGLSAPAATVTNRGPSSVNHSARRASRRARSRGSSTGESPCRQRPVQCAKLTAA